MIFRYINQIVDFDYQTMSVTKQISCKITKNSLVEYQNRENIIKAVVSYKIIFT